MRLPRRLSRRGSAGVLLVGLAAGLTLLASSDQKKNKEDITQTLQLPRELPTSVAGETRRLSYFVTPLSGKGLLSAQIRDALKTLARQTGSDTVLKIRAFVAGSGDVRRVRDLVSEVFTDRKQPLPVLSLIRSGGLPLEGAQVVLEAIAQNRKEVDPQGLALISAQIATSPDPLEPLSPLTGKSLEKLKQVVASAGSTSADVLRVTCFLSSLENLAASRSQVESEYPHAALNFVQTQRSPTQALAACEAVARLRTDPGAKLRFTAADSAEPGQAQAALIGARQVVLTGTQVSFGYQEADARLAFERLRKEIEQSGASIEDVAFAHFYPLSSRIATQVRKLRTEFFDPAHPPASSLLLFEGLPSMDAGFAVDAVVAK